MRRRELLGTIASASVAGLAGCSDGGGSSGGENTIIVGPDGSLTFDPDSLTVSAGTTVTWEFDSPSHNVSCDPDHHDEVSLPSGADPFASVDEAFDTNDEGETFEHTFETTGDYAYVCAPHVSSGMIGTVIVTE